MAWYNWSQTASSNATADATINWAEGQSPSSINDSARAMMAATAKYRDDIAGAIITSGTSTAYTVTSYSVFDTLAHLGGQTIAFSPHTTNGATVTLNVDSLGAKPLRSAPSTEIPAGTLIQGTPYLAIYNNSDGAFYLQGFFGNPYNAPVGGGMIYFGTSAPNSSFAFPYGQAVSRTTYSGLFGITGTTFGTGDGSTTFNLPDLRGRLPVGQDNMGGSAANRVTSGGSGITGTTLGATGGEQAHTLTQAELPNVAPTFTGTQASWNTNEGNIVRASSGVLQNISLSGGSTFFLPDQRNVASVTVTPAGTISVLGSGNAHNNMPPSIIVNYIIRLI